MQTQHTIDGDRTPELRHLVNRIFVQASGQADAVATVTAYGLELLLLKSRVKMVELETRIAPPGLVFIGSVDADLREDITTGLRECESVLLILEKWRLILRGSNDAQAFDRYVQTASDFESDPEAFHAEDRKLFRFASVIRPPITASV